MADWRNDFKVIKRFRDKENEQKVWEIGDTYSRSGEGKKARIEELAGSQNALGQPVIQEVAAHEEDAEEEGDS